jgi:hypothetical protein
MRLIMLVTLLGMAACCDPGSPLVGDSDLSVGADLRADPLAACPAGAEQVNGAKCSYGKDSQCRSTFGYACQCLCTGYWECDQVKVVCDPDAGAPGD